MNSNMQAPPRAPRSFSTLDDLMAWLASHHTTEPELWVRIYKRDSGTASVCGLDVRKDGEAIRRMLGDYKHLRDQIRICNDAR